MVISYNLKERTSFSKHVHLRLFINPASPWCWYFVCPLIIEIEYHTVAAAFVESLNAKNFY